MADTGLSEDLQRQLAMIEPTITESGVRLYPCAAKLKDGTLRDCVYLVDAASFLCLTTFRHPADMTDVRWLSPSDLAWINDSPWRLPARFAKQIHEAGESGMGHRVFTVVFSWWCRRVYVQSVVDFIEYPPGKNGSKIKAVLPHIGERKAGANSQPSVYWCVFSA